MSETQTSEESADEINEQALLKNPDSQANTQPLNSEDERQSPLLANLKEPWGFLLPSNELFDSVALIKDTFIFTRIRGDVWEDNVQVYLIQENRFPSADPYVCFSRQHFKIFKVDDEIFIEDTSSNGTFVNNELVGKNRTRPLIHKDRVTFAHKALGGFVFQLVLKEDNAFEDDFAKLPTQVTSNYIIGRMIGFGISGKVYLAYKRNTNYRRFALKVIRTTNASAECVNEGKILTKLSHPNIIKIEDTFVSDQFYVIVMELASGGELFKYILDDFKNKTFDEKVAKLQFYQILCGVCYMHEKMVCHRDLKLENILVSEKNRESLLKIADFGVSKVGNGLKTFVGTKHFIAPEVLKNGFAQHFEKYTYTLNADMWSLGCILFSLLCGSPAFNSATDDGLHKKILEGKYNIHHPGLKKISSEAKDLLSCLLRVDTSLRIDAKTALAHPWLKDREVIEKAEALAGRSLELGVRSISRGVRDIVLHSSISPSRNNNRRNSITTKSNKRKSVTDEDYCLPSKKIQN